MDHVLLRACMLYRPCYRLMGVRHISVGEYIQRRRAISGFQCEGFVVPKL